MISKKISHFRVLDKIGEGGMGVVYRAEDENLGRRVALKVLPAGFAGNEERRLRFIREARTAAAVTHPNIATIHEIIEEGEGIYIAMELLEGESLADHIGAKPLPTDDLLRLAIGIAEGLAKAHGAGVIHRDLKPDNVKLSDDGHPKILDFGLAKVFEETGADREQDVTRAPTVSVNVTQEGHILGTVAYMSPEQARGLELDARSDIFSCGVMLYEMATGKAPFEGATVTDTLSAILRDAQAPIFHSNPQAPAELERIIAKCLEKEPANRYQSIDDLLVDLRNLKRTTDSHSISVPRVSAPELEPLRNVPLWKRPLAVGVFALVLLGLIWVIPGLYQRPSGIDRVARTVGDSLAVLPFQNMQDSGDAERIGQILQELVITDLSDVTSMRVLSSQRLFDIQKQLGRDRTTTIDQDLASEVAARAGAGMMLTGSISQLGEKWILTSQLVEVSDGTVLKSERIDGDNLYDMVDDLTQRIRGNMGMVETARRGSDLAIEQRTSSSLAAYQHYLAGSERLNELHYEQAIEALRKAVAIDPDFGQAYYKLAIAEWWERGLETPRGEGPDAPEAVLARLASGELKASEKYRMLAGASLALVQGHYDDAVPLFRAVADRYPDEKEAWYGLGEAVYHTEDQQRRPEALDAFERSLALDPAFTVSYRHVFDIYTMQRRYDDIIARAQTLIASKPGDARFYSYWMIGAINKGDEAQAQSALRQGLAHAATAEDRAALHLDAARAYKQIGDYTNALAFTRKAVGAGGTQGRVARQLLGYHAILAGHVEEAERAFEDLLSADPPHPLALGGLAVVAMQRKDWDRSSEFAEKWVEADPDNVDAIGTAMGLHLRRGELAAAEKLFRTRFDATEDEWRKRQLCQRSAKLYLQAGDYAKAEQLARDAASGGHGKPLNTASVLVAALAYQGKLDEAQRLLTRALEQDRYSGDLQGRMIELKVLQGRVREAEQDLRRMLEQGPADRAVHWGLALVLAELDRFAEAEAHARKALSMDPGRVSRTVLAWVLIAGNRGIDEGLRLAGEAQDMVADIDGPPPAPFLPSPEHCIGLAQMRRGEYEQAARTLQEAARLRPDRPRIREDLAQARAKIS